MHTNAKYSPPAGADFAPMFPDIDRGSVTEEQPAPRHAGPLDEAPSYPPLCGHGMNALTDRGYVLARARLRRG